MQAIREDCGADERVSGAHTASSQIDYLVIISGSTVQPRHRVPQRVVTSIRTKTVSPVLEMQLLACCFAIHTRNIEEEE